MQIVEKFLQSKTIKKTLEPKCHNIFQKYQLYGIEQKLQYLNLKSRKKNQYYKRIYC